METIEVVQSATWSSSLLGGLKDLYATGQMFDVELVENSGRSLWAHSCVLAAACPLMKNAFMQTASQSPRRIFYADINIDRWKQLLDFIYLGQVSVAPSQIPQLLNTAGNLGLTELQQACREVMEAREQIVSVTPRKPQRPLINKPSAQSLSSKKRNMLERIPPNEQLPVILGEDVAGGDGTRRTKNIVVKREEDDEDNAEEIEVPVGDENTGPDDVGKQVEAGTYRCTKCNKDLPYGTSLFRHELRHKMFPNLKKKNSGKYQCSKCVKRFATKNAKNMHERNHNKEPKFKCQHCDEKFFFEFVRDKHIIKDHAELEPEMVATQLPCDAPNCTKTFATEALLRIHRSRKHGLKDESARPDKPIPCDLCGKEVLWLAEHKKSVHPEEMGETREDHACPECGKVMKYASSLKRHMYLHQEGGAVNCPHCDKPFNHPSSLWSHFPSCPKVPPEEKLLLKAPSSTKKYKRKPKQLTCEMCNKTFTNLRNYRNHVDNHLGKYKHMCGHCGKKFQNTNHYSDHMNRHYGVKPYECPHCAHTFASKSDMKQHIRQHTGERPFQCPLCNREFVHRSNCYAHARKAHNKELAANPELAKMCKVANRENMQTVAVEDAAKMDDVGELVEEEETTIMVVADPTGEGDKDVLVATEQGQETVQFAELLLSQHDKSAAGSQQIQTLGGQTFTTIQADSATGTLNTVLVPQYNVMQYSNQQGTSNIYTTTVANANEFQQQQAQPQQQQGTQELKFCLYDG